MSPLLKKVVTAMAIKEGIDRIQEARRPKRSRLARMRPPLTLAALGGLVFFLFKSGKLDPIVAQAKGLMGGDEGASVPPYPPAPAATNGATATGAASTSTSI